jgi:FkbM family methyltransferase
MINTIRLGRIVRRISTKLGIFSLLRKFVFICRGNRQPAIDRKFYEQILKPGDLVFDVGANRGQSSECFIGIGARVIAFEPQIDLHNEIRQICGRSGLLTVDPSALGKKEEKRKLFLTEYDQVASLREDWEGIRIGESVVKISTLDNKIFEYGSPRYCKIDVEGWEYEVILGLGQQLEIISFEYHLSESEIIAAKKVLLRLTELGSYWCNVRESSAEEFFLPNFVEISNFLERFPNRLGVPLRDGYGDIFAVLDPAQFQIAEHKSAGF